MWYKWILFSLFSAWLPGSGGRNNVESIVAQQGVPVAENNVADSIATKSLFKMVLNDPAAARGIVRARLGYSASGLPVDAWYFPGTSNERALIIGGMHGSELSSITLAEKLITALQAGEPSYYSVVVVPALFPDNAAAAAGLPQQIGSMQNIGRYSYRGATDPNRQMPSPGRAFDAATGLDHLGRAIETENEFLLELIQEFRPTRIANLHAIRDLDRGGIYADPRTDHHGIALGFESDSLLAIKMALAAWEAGGAMKGNGLPEQANTIYYRDPAAVPAGQWQPRNFTGSFGKQRRGSGVSMGTWGSTAIALETNAELNRPAMRVITIEFPGSKRPEDYLKTTDRDRCARQLDAFVTALKKVFLADGITDI